MTLEIFFQKFDQFADAPNAVAKMRELVLHLAVQGKLVEQDSGNEPANISLERIRKTKSRLINERAIRRQDTDPISDDEAPFAIPSSWVWTRLGEIGDWGSGSTPARGNQALYGGGIAWLKSGELNDNQILAGSEETLTELALTTGSFRRNQPGDVLLAMYGATIGKAAILAEPAVTNQAVCGCTPFEGVANRYLFNYLISQRANFHSASEGGAQPNISKVKIVSFPFPLPPLAEQKRIVAKVDELMAICDRLEAQQQERETRHAALARASLARFANTPNPASLNFLFHKSYTIPPADLRKSILNLAIQGLLVPRQTADGKGSAVVNEYSLRGLPDSDHILDLELPEHWAITPFSNLARIRSGVTKGRNLAGRKLKAFPYLRVANVQRGYLALDVMKDIEIPFEELEKYRLESNDLLITEGGDWDKVGRTAIWREELRDCIHQNHVFRARLVSEELKPEWFMLYLNSPIGRRYFESAAKQTTNLASINATELRGCPVPIPPLAEQRRIVAKVDQLMAMVDQLETQLATSRATAANLLQALVAGLSQQP